MYNVVNKTEDIIDSLSLALLSGSAGFVVIIQIFNPRNINLLEKLR